MNIDRVKELTLKYRPSFEDLDPRYKQTVRITCVNHDGDMPESLLLCGENKETVSQAQAITRKMLESDPFEPNNCVACSWGLARNMVNDDISIIIAVISPAPDEANQAVTFWLDIFAKEFSV